MRLVAKLKAFFKNAKKRKAVVGLSGGVDSSLVLWLCAKALGPKNVFAFHLPYNEIEVNDAEEFARKLGANYERVPIKETVDEAIRSTKAGDAVSRGNIMARTRMLFLYTFAREHDALVVGTGNKSEISIGYFTKHGDGGVDVLPLGNVYKTDVWALARKAGVPEKIIKKAPSAGLWDGQTDEDEIGLTYAELDETLKTNGKTNRVSGEKKKLVALKKKQAEHKLKMPEIL